MSIKSKKGFTIIEVVLVLAIAGLIFLMVFIALPNMQRSQRDTARRNDYAAFSANITNYISNNNGRLPKPGATLDASKYINTEGKDTSGIAYKITVVDLSATGAQVTELTPLDKNTANKVDVYLYTAADCKGDSAAGTAMPKKNTSARAFAVYAQLETGTYCQESN